MDKLSESQYRQRIKKVHSELKHKWNEQNQRINFCIQHKFETEANLLRKENAVRYDAIIML